MSKLLTQTPVMRNFAQRQVSMSHRTREGTRRWMQDLFSRSAERSELLIELEARSVTRQWRACAMSCLSIFSASWSLQLTRDFKYETFRDQWTPLSIGSFSERTRAKEITSEKEWHRIHITASTCVRLYNISKMHGFSVGPYKYAECNLNLF